VALRSAREKHQVTIRSINTSAGSAVDASMLLRIDGSRYFGTRLHP
jgi:hypothetical protein